MSDQLLDAVAVVQSQFLQAEEAADLAAARSARLLATILEQRAAHAVGKGVAAMMVRKVARSLVAQVDALDDYLVAHKAALSVPGELGLDVTMFGDMSPCPPDEQRALFGASDGVVQLRAAA